MIVSKMNILKKPTYMYHGIKFNQISAKYSKFIRAQIVDHKYFFPFCLQKMFSNVKSIVYIFFIYCVGIAKTRNNISNGIDI